MGVKLTGIPSRPVVPSDLLGRVVAIDAPNLMYAFYAVQMLRGPATPEALDAARKAAVRGLGARVLDLRNAGAKPVVVFDGPPHPAKMEHLAAREETRSFPALAAQHYAPARAAARALGVPTVDAPHDAEAQACAMARRGLVDVVATTDWDALAMGAPALLRNLSANPQSQDARRWTHVEAAQALDFLQVDASTLALAAVLMGCDYFDGFPRFGPGRALKLARETKGDLKAALAVVGASPQQAQEAERALACFHDPPHRDAPRFAWVAPDTDAYLRALQGAPEPPRRAGQAKLDGAWSA